MPAGKDRIRSDVDALLLSTAKADRYQVIFENTAEEHGAKDQILERVPQKGCRRATPFT